jgi:uncharacterized protein YebE (UPF0316 family)
MGIGLDPATLLTGALIFLARIIDVTLGTVRTINIVHGRTRTAFFLGFLEVSVWLVVISTVVSKVMAAPILGIFYAFGFSTGNVLGIRLERRIGAGHTVLRVVSPRNGKTMAADIREAGYPVTTFQGEGMSGPVTELYVVCRRRDVDELVQIARNIEPDAFYITEQAGSVSKIYRPSMQQLTGWRAILKRK